MTLKELNTKLKSFSFEKELLDILKQNAHVLAEYQRRQWGETSTDAKGKKLKLLDNRQYGYLYRPQTVALKKKYGIGLGAVTDRITFYSRGSLYEGLFAKVQKDKIVFGSTVSYFKSLMKRAGNPEGLNPDYIKKFKEEVLIPQIKLRLKQKTGLVL